MYLSLNRPSTPSAYLERLRPESVEVELGGPPEQGHLGLAGVEAARLAPVQLHGALLQSAAGPPHQAVVGGVPAALLLWVVVPRLNWGEWGSVSGGQG